MTGKDNMSNKYYIMYKDIPVVEFNFKTQEYKYLNFSLLPLVIANIEPSWHAIQMFCSSRNMVYNRKYHNEILKECKIDEYTDINICIQGKGLSLRDNYWIKKADSLDTWKNVNLYNKEFSKKVAYAALTGEMSSDNINEDIITGELTNKGTKAKCFYKNKNGIFLFKDESEEEIAVELISSIIANKMNLKSALYMKSRLYGKECSVCEIETSEKIELIHARDVIKYYNCEMNKDTLYYNFFYNLDKVNFIKMQLFDYITLNIDRNRDNFGIKKVNDNFIGLYPIYDHDSCFKGKSLNAHYFVTGEKFNQLLPFLKSLDPVIYRNIIKFNIIKLYNYFKGEGKEIFKMYNLEKEYDKFIERIETILKGEKQCY